jgi:hypothetical protein
MYLLRFLDRTMSFVNGIEAIAELEQRRRNGPTVS